MTAKQLSFGDEAREKIRRGVDTLAEAVKLGLGPRGRTVILQRDFGAPRIANSGVLVAKAMLQGIAVLTGGRVVSEETGLAQAFGYNAATREYGDLLQMGVIDPAKVTRLALQNAGSIAGLILTTDCLIANAPTPAVAAMPGGAAPEF
jgi:chaperonin GroEL (HSP60 family)